jgi:hypothetical protein
MPFVANIFAHGADPGRRIKSARDALEPSLEMIIVSSRTEGTYIKLICSFNSGGS